MKSRSIGLVVLLMVAAGLGAVSQQRAETVDSSSMSSVSPEDWRWEPIPNMKPGAQRVVLRQDPATGATELVARYPEGYVVRWHWHTANERLVVLQGRFRIEAKGHQIQLERGGFVFQPGKNVHQVSCISGECMYYALWDGKWDINYVDPP